MFKMGKYIKILATPKWKMWPENDAEENLCRVFAQPNKAN